MQDKFEDHIPITEESTILQCLSERTELSKQAIKRVMQNGAVWLESKHGIARIRRAKKALTIGDIVHIYYDEKVQKSVPIAAQLIADEGEYSIWNKPCGMFSQGSKWGDHCTIYRWAEVNLMPQRPAFLVHRLDRAANGLIIIAHSKSMAASFSKMFAQHEIKKIYKATVNGCMTDLKLPYKITEDIDDKAALSEIISLDVKHKINTTDVLITIATGRKHQIRKHLSALQFPVVGDRLYGEGNAEVDLKLSSVSLDFICPITNENKHYAL